MDRPVDPELSARFRADLARLWAGDGKLALAVSGGPDSMAMLVLARAAIPGRIEAATVDHGLRPEAAAEAQMVAAVCAELHVPHQILNVSVAGGNLQDAARNARYAALGQWAGERALQALATAHHADDQAETLLMRLNRGSGVAGLAGVRELGSVPGTRIPLVRPLLSWRRAQLAQTVEAAGLAPAQDPSNHDERFDRVRMRAVLAQTDGIDPVALSASASHLSQADAALEWATDREWQDRVSHDDAAYLYESAAPRAIRLRIAARIIDKLGGTARGGAIARLVDTLEAGAPATLAGIAATANAGVWKFAREPQTRKN